MKQFLAITKALSDETRVRAMLSLREGELCLCQVIDLLRLAPSTVSKHMDLLVQAGLVERRKEGRWQYFALARRNAAPAVREALAWTLKALEADPIVSADAKKLGCVRKKGLEEVCACYRGS
jgi:ArsR family transcriptional regulator, arsenate/arsenite/antimonite-responsive transcriptional repressor